MCVGLVYVCYVQLLYHCINTNSQTLVPWHGTQIYKRTGHNIIFDLGFSETDVEWVVSNLAVQQT